MGLLFLGLAGLLLIKGGIDRIQLIRFLSF